MKDYRELKKLAEALIDLNRKNLMDWAAAIEDARIGKTHTEYALSAKPAAVLALIAEVERLSFREKMLSEYGCEYCAGSGHVHRIDGDYLGVCDSCSAYEFNCAKHEIEKLKNENESLKKDAARYRWLRDESIDPGSVIDKKIGHSYVGDYPIYEYRAGQELDDAIDAEMIEVNNK